jgi:signal peptidase I
MRELAQTAILAGLIFLVVRIAVQNFRVQGDSMQPTLHNDEYVVVDRAEYWFRAPERGDVVVFRAVPADNPDRDFIKRIIAQPGDTVEIRGGRVYVNGRQLHETYISSPSIDSFALRRVPQNSYFVLGDNRNNSFDSSRWPRTPWLDRKYIIGRAWISYWPANELTSLDIRMF